MIKHISSKQTVMRLGMLAIFSSVLAACASQPTYNASQSTAQKPIPMTKTAKPEAVPAVQVTQTTVVQPTAVAQAPSAAPVVPTVQVVQTQQTSTIQTVESHDHGHDHNYEHNYVDVSGSSVGSPTHFTKWYNNNPSSQAIIDEYQAYLASNLGEKNVPPMSQLLTTARSWQSCGYQPYQVPPRDLWDKMVPTIRLYNDLRAQGILPAETQIRSVYRSPALNRCAGGASSSRHMTNGAMDIWVPSYGANSFELRDMQDRLCQFWIDKGAQYNFGLGLYATGSMHLDTQGYRKWGANFSRAGSVCRSA